MQVIKPLPLLKDVLFALKDCEIFHFAGHAWPSPEDPLQSCLLFESGHMESLTVASLFEMSLHDKHPFLAYLSACGTGLVKHAKLIDEILHLISACQLAGFQNVIGTLWETKDKAYMDIAVMTYKWILDQGLSGELVSEGLHRASRSLRDQWILKNSEREALKRDVGVKTTKDDQMATEGSYSIQDKVKDSISFFDCDDVRPSQPYWAPYVHFGV